VFGEGPRRPLDREQRARFKFLLNLHYRARRVTPKGEKVALALLKRLGADGQCDPTHQTLATDVACDEKTVRRALDRLKSLGLVQWVNRIIRDGWRAAQTSNGYLLVPTEVVNLPADRPARCGGQNARQTRLESFSYVQTASLADVRAAQAALARRRAAVEGRFASLFSRPASIPA
jgi:DNA-binding transcriptional MocR family regulator